MGAIPEKTIEPQGKDSSKKLLVMVGGIIGAIAIVGLLYMVVYVAPEEIVERVTVIAITQNGCIAETFDGFAVNIGQCDAQPGDILMAPVDQKIKERAMAMNPT